jgi:hypothetical protein
LHIKKEMRTFAPPYTPPPIRIPYLVPRIAPPKRGVKHPCESFRKKNLGTTFFQKIDPFLDPNGFLKKFLGVFLFGKFGVFILKELL